MASWCYASAAFPFGYPRGQVETTHSELHMAKYDYDLLLWFCWVSVNVHVYKRCSIRIPPDIVIGFRIQLPLIRKGRKFRSRNLNSSTFVSVISHFIVTFVLKRRKQLHSLFISHVLFSISIALLLVRLSFLYKFHYCST